MTSRLPIKDLEAEFFKARNNNLVADVVCNPHLSECYILVVFHKSTNKKTRLKILRYVKIKYDVIDVQLIDDDDSIFITYDYWSRYVDRGPVS